MSLLRPLRINGPNSAVVGAALVSHIIQGDQKFSMHFFS